MKLENVFFAAPLMAAMLAFGLFVSSCDRDDDPVEDNKVVTPEEITAYSKWLGTWKYEAEGTSLNITIAEKTKDESYAIKGLFGDYEIEAVFESETSGLAICGDQLLEEGKTDLEVPFGIYLYGMDSDELYELGNPAKAYRLAIGALGEDAKSATLAGDVYEVVYGSVNYDEEIVSFGLVPMSSDENGDRVEEDPLDLPFIALPGTLTKVEE